MHRAGLIIYLVGLLAVAPAQARILWPWERAAGAHRQGHAPAAAAPDCAQVNAAIKALPPDRLARAMQAASREQQKVIAACVERAP